MKNTLFLVDKWVLELKKCPGMPMVAWLYEKFKNELSLLISSI
jgi:hypothetical protein